jgi:hypothetical protein
MASPLYTGNKAPVRRRCLLSSPALTADGESGRRAYGAGKAWFDPLATPVSVPLTNPGRDRASRSADCAFGLDVCIIGKMEMRAHKCCKIRPRVMEGSE